jgi:imidazolonepropionase-like amidohydrolase
MRTFPMSLRALLVGLYSLAGVAPAQEREPGFRPGAYAVRGARIIVEPGRVIEKGTVVLRGGRIEAVGAGVAVPFDAEVIEGEGLTVVAGFVDGLSHRGLDPKAERSRTGGGRAFDYSKNASAATPPDNRKGMTPEYSAAEAVSLDAAASDAWRRLGFTASLIAPEGIIVTGRSALVSHSGLPRREIVLAGPVGLHANFRSTGPDYPNTTMGVIAHIRQTLIDAEHHRRSWAHHERTGRQGAAPPSDPALEALAPVLDGKLRVFLEADTFDEIHRALNFAEEFNLSVGIVGGAEAYRVVDRLKARSAPVIVRIELPEEPKVDGGDEMGGAPRRVRADQHRRWRERAGCAAALHAAGIRFALGSMGTEKADKAAAGLRAAVKHGLSPDGFLAALTVNPAKICGLEGRAGTVEAGQLAHLAVFSAHPADPDAKLRYAFCDGVKFDYTSPDSARPRPALTPAGKVGKGKREPKAGEPEKAVAKDEPAAVPMEKAPERKPDPVPVAGIGAEPATEIDEDRRPRTKTGGNVLIRNATILTVTKGTILRGSILVRDGKIAAVGETVEAPPDIPVIDAYERFVMPGIVDTHSHMAISGGVNEATLSIVPEVRIKDVVNGSDLQLFRSLAGGVTTARLLHGSANCIGGQDAVIKLKYGRPAQDIILHGPQGVKFALGENVKRTPRRFPNTRLGVEAVFLRAFTEAQAYRAEWERYGRERAGGKDVPEPRRDLRLEALARILTGDIRVHCHCYRSDEILMILRVADAFGIKIRSLQHGLEAFKVAPEIAAHGASVSTFSDWWAYKIEAGDAVPHNVALMFEAGVTPLIKSDSHELVRHLYLEAAKTVKYGGMPEDEALATITINAALQLGLEKRIGSIEVGKDADLAIFNGHPFNTFSRCEMTLVEGEVFFERNGAKAGPHPIPPQAGAPRRKALEIAGNADRTYVIKGATVHTMEGPPLVGGTVVLKAGKIVAVGADVETPGGATVIDAAGLSVYPGLIDAGNILGLIEFGSARETQDQNEIGELQPDLTAATAVNPDSEMIPVTRINGVTTVLTRPVGGLIAGQASLIHLDGWVPAEMTIEPAAGLFIGLGRLPAGPNFGTLFPDRSPADNAARKDRIKRLRELFDRARLYETVRDAAARRGEPAPAPDRRLEAMLPYAHGRKPVIVYADLRPEILDAIEFAEQQKLKLIIAGGKDAWKCADVLAKKGVPVILGPVLALPNETFDPYDGPYACAAKLHAAGVKFCIQTAGAANVRNLPYEAATAVAYGLPAEEGLRAVTTSPAEILGVADRLGSLSVGKIGDVIITDGDPLQVTTNVVGVFINGNPIELTSKQTKLYERYKKRIEQNRRP